MLIPVLDFTEDAEQALAITFTPATDLNSEQKQARARYRQDICAFAEEVLGIELAPYQRDILQKFLERRRAAVRGPHGLGKTAISSIVVVWAVTTHDCDVKVVTTASAWRQLTEYTWPEIHKWSRRADWSKLGIQIRPDKELLSLSLTVDDKSAFAAASDNPALLEGAHASLVVVVFDEAKAIPVATWDALEGAFSTGDAYALAISTPGDTSGRFYDIHTHKPGYSDWWTRHVTIQEAIAAGRINPSWVEDRRQQWGETSAVFQNRVLGEFADSDESSLIPLGWVEAANRRWRELDGIGEGDTTYGVDPARFGTDKTAIVRLVGTVVEAINRYSREDTMQTAGRVAALIADGEAAAIDVIGIGAGVYDRLMEQDLQVIAVNVAESTDMTDASGKQKFLNLRSALWWMLRERLDPNGDEPVALPPDDYLTGDLTAPTWTYTSNGRVKVESKDDIRERIGRSTDSADALALALYAGRYAGMSLIDFA